MPITGPPIKRTVVLANPSKTKLVQRAAPRRDALAFIPKADNPLEGVDTTGMTGEEAIKAEVGAAAKSLRQKMKEEEQRRSQAVSTDDYFVVAFASGEQATAFLQAVNYHDLSNRFVDGTILAEKLGIGLPAAPKRRLLQRHAKLDRLVTKPWRGKKAE